MLKLIPIAAVLVMAAAIASTGVVSAATIPARPGGDSAVAAQVEGDTYVLLGPSVFGVTVQQDPLAYSAVELADGAVHGHWRYDLWQAGQETTYSGTVTCMTVSGRHAWVGGPVTGSSDPTAVGMGAWWQVADNGTGRHPITPTRPPSSEWGPWPRRWPTAPASTAFHLRRPARRGPDRRSRERRVAAR